MNTRQLQYAITLAKIRNFSQVAEMFHISQPALSKQILNLENELGVKLFNRHCIPLTLTAAGDYFIQNAQQLLYKEDQLLRSMEQFKSGEKGRLEIGISPFRNLCLMPSIIQKVKERYPGIQVILHESNSDQLRKDAADGKYDFAIVNLPVDESSLDIIPLEPESLVLAVPNAMVTSITASADLLQRELDFSDCRNLPFVVVAHPQEMRLYFDRLCSTANISPNISIEVSGGVTTAWSMAHAGLGATLLPTQFAESSLFSDNLTLLKIKNAGYVRQPVVATKHGQYISEYARYAIELLKR